MKEVILEAGKQFSICTCGQSKNLPFCDSSHKKINEERGTSYHSLKICSPIIIELKIEQRISKAKELFGILKRKEAASKSMKDIDRALDFKREFVKK